MSVPSPFSVRLFTPLPEQRAVRTVPLFVARGDNLSYTTNLDAGFASCSVALRPPVTTPLVDATSFAGVGLLSHVQIVAGEVVLWEGAVTDYDDGPIPSDFTAQGYGTIALSGGRFARTDTTPSTSGPVLRQIAADTAPLIRIANDPIQFQDPGVQHTNSEFTSASLADALNQVVKEGGTDGNIWYSAVWEDRTLILRPLIAPALPDYLFPFDPTFVARKTTMQNMVSAVEVAYTDAVTGTAELTPLKISDRFAAQFGMLWQFVAHLDGGTLSSDAALKLRDTALATYDHPQSSVNISVPAGTWLPRARGTIGSPLMARAGQWAQVLDREDVLPIQQTEWRSGEGLSLTLGIAAATVADLYRSYDAVAAAVSKNRALSSNAVRP